MISVNVQRIVLSGIVSSNCVYFSRSGLIIPLRANMIWANVDISKNDIFDQTYKHWIKRSINSNVFPLYFFKFYQVMIGETGGSDSLAQAI